MSNVISLCYYHRIHGYILLIQTEGNLRNNDGDAFHWHLNYTAYGEVIVLIGNRWSYWLLFSGVKMFMVTCTQHTSRYQAYYLTRRLFFFNWLFPNKSVYGEIVANVVLGITNAFFPKELSPGKCLVLEVICARHTFDTNI